VRAIWRARFRHLRLPFNLLLSPMYLWGVWLIGGEPEPLPLVVGYLALHVFLYGGTNALNSYFDRDEGPVGGMWSPPPVDPGLLTFAWWVQGAGFLLALAVGIPFALVYAALFVVATAYSHPRWRWKSHPRAAIATVALGQGGLGTLAGAAAAIATGATGATAAGLASAPVALGMLVAAASITGLYVISQVYQTGEDRRRGDVTYPVLVGPARALRASLLASGVGAAGLLAIVALRVGGVAALGPLLLAVALLFAAIGIATLRWAARFDESDLRGNFRRAMALMASGAFGLIVFLLALLLR
jgi:4-hydroxybenzoate polyprenyltransferase